MKNNLEVLRMKNNIFSDESNFNVFGSWTFPNFLSFVFSMYISSLQLYHKNTTFLKESLTKF